ncbi:T9SS type A sorting domain-containing protein [Flavobacterium agri]|nr:T9SS type A sorting domain-containing protein [Flavobacterium agri]
MRKIYSLLFIVAAAFTGTAQVTISQWNFDADLPGAMSPTTGGGTFTTIGGVEDNLTSGVMPAGNPSTGKAYSIKTFPAAGTASGTAGFQFMVVTANYTGITVSFDPRGSNTASKWQQYQYTIDGGANWTVVGNNAGALTNAFTTTPMVTVTLPADAANKDGFGFRIVSIFDPAGTDYAPVAAASTYGPGGAWRIDNFTVTGTSLGTHQNQIAGLKLYPNPVTNGVLNVTTDNNEIKEVTVFDVLGKQVVKASTEQVVNVSNLKTGVYMVKVTEAGKTATRKLVIK